MKKIVLISIMLGGSIASLAQSNAVPVATPLQYTLTLPTVKDAPFDVTLRLGGDNKPGCKITYLVSGENIISIDKDSVKIDSVTGSDGKDLSKNSRGRASWSFDSAHNVSDDGGHAFFSIFVDTESGAGIPNIKGSIGAKVARKPETKTLAFKTGEKGQAQDAGPLSFSVADKATDIGKPGEQSFERSFLSASFTSSFNGSSRSRKFSSSTSSSSSFDDDEVNDFGILMEGDKRLVKEISINDGGKKIKQRGFRNSGDQTVYSFSKAPAAPEFTLTVTYLDDIQDVEIVFGENMSGTNPGTTDKDL
jgi:hypothetical protein